MSNQARRIERNINGNAVMEAERQARLEARQERGKLLVERYSDTVVSAFILGQALVKPPANEAEAEQVGLAVTHLEGMALAGLVPPQLLTPIGQMKAIIAKAAEMAEAQPNEDSLSGPNSQNGPCVTQEASDVAVG